MAGKKSAKQADPAEKPGRGGTRPGAGRKRKAEKFAGTIARVETEIARRLMSGKDGLPGVVDAMLELALGVAVQETDRETGEVNVYERPPDYKAAAYLIDRILGKPTERRELKVESLSDDELIERTAALLSGIAAADGGDGAAGPGSADPDGEG